MSGKFAKLHSLQNGSAKDVKQGGIIIITGSPGTGKTTIALEIIFKFMQELQALTEIVGAFFATHF